MTKIEWTDKTWNPIRARNKATGGVGHYCAHVSEGCRNCYAEGMQKRLFNNPIRYAAQDREKVDIFLDEKALLAPLRWKKPRMIFVCSMTDLFADWVADAWIDQVFAVMALCPQHTFQCLTKRPDRMREYLTRPAGGGKQEIRNHLAWEVTGHVMNLWAPAWKKEEINGKHRRRAIGAFAEWPLPNVWLGTSVEDQASADDRIPHLLATPAAIRFISAEPLLGPVDLRPTYPEQPWHHAHDGIAPFGWDYRRYDPLTGVHEWEDGPDDCSVAVKWRDERLHWIIVGGESGPGARPMHPDWARSVRDQCAAAGVAFFFKQWGDWVTVYDRDVDDPDWRHCSKAEGPHERYVNIVGGHGFHNDRVVFMRRVGKKAAGRLLDGREHNDFPEPLIPAQAGIQEPA